MGKYIKINRKGVLISLSVSIAVVLIDFITKLMVMKNMTLGAIETHVADARTCCLHPASATHRQMNDDELRAAGVSPDLIRYSCGIESAEDLIEDLERALSSIE